MSLQIGAMAAGDYDKVFRLWQVSIVATRRT
jgi:hypothetical protein